MNELFCIVEGKGPAVVLLHPVGLDQSFWNPVSASLVETFTVIRPDLRGHGASPPATSGAQLEDYAHDVHGVIARRGGKPAAIIGLSFGGMIAQVLALEHPENVAALVISGCTATFPPEAREMLRARGTAAREGGMAAVVEGTLERWFTPSFLAAGGGDATRRRLLANDVEGWAAGWEAISRHNAAPRLAEIAAPTLCIAGEHDAAAPPQAMRPLANAIPGARLEVLAGAPHMMQVECPGAYAEAVARFLFGVLRDGAWPHPA